jgi:hypothetical protein
MNVFNCPVCSGLEEISRSEWRCKCVFITVYSSEKEKTLNILIRLDDGYGEMIKCENSEKDIYFGVWDEKRYRYERINRLKFLLKFEEMVRKQTELWNVRILEL